jgi:c-di-GMP-binding flagellar brake protein YcgR
MKIIEIPVNTVVELKFYYYGMRYKVGVGLLYQYGNTVYVSALKSAGKTVPASKLRNVTLIYHTNLGRYIFHNVSIRSLSLNGQKLYAICSDTEAQIKKYKKSYRLYLGANIVARVINTDGTEEELRCILKDISANGMGILSHYKVEETAKIEISFKLYDKKETLIGMIVRTDEFKNGSGYLYGCEFEEPNEIIGKYVAQQVEKLLMEKEKKLSTRQNM